VLTPHPPPPASLGTFTYFPSPNVSHIEPVSAPMSAARTVVTVYGSRFFSGAGADPKCRFGADVSTATLVEPGGTAMPYLECSVGPATSGVAVRPPCKK
jgi:hypothetical protein